MDRLTYISTFNKDLTSKEINKIGKLSKINNSKQDLTGILFTFEKYFYQIIEGPKEKLNETYKKIKNDSRHKNIFCLQLEENISNRNFKKWGMKSVNLNDTNDILLIPIRSILNSLAHNYFITEKYIPSTISNALKNGVNPTLWNPRIAKKTIIFADMFSSTTLTQFIKSEDLYYLLNTFYEIATDEIRKCNGVFSKFTGDGFMAYFDAEETDIAVEVAQNILHRVKNFRNNKKNSLDNFLHIGIGMSSGEVHQGNIGTKDRMDFTLLGNAVNLAARLESISRKTNYYLIFDSSVRDNLTKNNNVIKLGHYLPKGKLSKIEIFSLENENTKHEITIKQLKMDIVASKYE